MKIAIIIFAILFVSCANDGFNEPTIVKKYVTNPVGDEPLRFFVKVRTIVNGTPTFKDYEIALAFYDAYQIDDKFKEW
jgi:hypothetical protein